MLQEAALAAGEWLEGTPNMLWEVPFLIWVCLEMQHNAYKQSPMYSMVFCYLCYCFGGIVQIFVTGIHGDRPFHGIVPDDDEAVVFFVVWFAVFYTKFNLLVSSRLGLLVVSLMSAVGWARAVMWQFDEAVTWYPDQLLAPLLSATCSGYGGVLCMALEAVLFDRPERHRLTPSVRGSIKTSISMATMYWGMCAGLGMPQVVAKLIVTAMIIAWSILGQLAGVYVDPCLPVELVFRKLVVAFCGPHHEHLLNSFMVHGAAKKADKSVFREDAPKTESHLEEEKHGAAPSEAAELDYGVEEFSAEDSSLRRRK